MQEGGSESAGKGPAAGNYIRGEDKEEAKECGKGNRIGWKKKEREKVKIRKESRGRLHEVDERTKE